jgi:hypothetical protein
MRGKTALKKKAYITLKEGHKIDIVSGVPSGNSTRALPFGTGSHALHEWLR